MNGSRNMMIVNNSVVAIHPVHTAVKKLLQSGFDMKKLLMVGRDHHIDDCVMRVSNAWGGQDAVRPVT
jgi:hypothetical protein